MIGVFLALLVLTTLLWVLLKALGVIKTGPDFSDPKATIAFGLAVFNLILWGMVPWFWDVLTYQWYVPILFNLGLGAFLYLRKADGKTLASLVGGALVIGLITTAWFEAGSSLKSRGYHIPFFGSKGSVLQTQTSVPLEVAMRVVCECESGCKQFEPNGKTPLKNKGIPSKGIKPSTAFGKYQFLEVHRKPAIDLGFDLDTEKGQDDYFAYIYAKEEFGPWDHDEEYGGGRACWGPKLVALGYSGAPTSSPKMAEVILEGPVFDWGRPFKPRRGFNITTDWVDLKAKERHQLEIVTTEGTFVKTFPSSTGKTEEIKGDIIQYRVKSLENKPVFIKITLTPV